MKHLKLRIHVSEPFDFARENDGNDELTGWTTDYTDETADEWEITLDHGYDFHEVHHGRILVSPRYVGEHLSQLHNALMGLPVRIAHRLHNEWHYSMAGVLSVLHHKEEEN